MPLSAPLTPVEARTLAVHSGTLRAEGMRMKATSAAMLHLLTMLVPPGRTSHYGVSADDDLRVQLYLDDGQGPALVRVAVGEAPFARPSAGNPSGIVTAVRRNGADCLRSTVVGAQRADGTTVEIDIATCLPDDGLPPARPALDIADAVRIATDPRWGVTMDPLLVKAGAKRFAGLPVFSG
jgi:hypothetical protein